MRPVALALLSAALTVSCQWALVHSAHHGNWTALFCAGERFQRPAEIAQHEYVFRGIDGYDGQFYQVIAHDPLLLRHYDRYIDAARVRYRRILLPGLAWVLALGQPRAIDWGCFAVCWLFVALGTFCLAQLAVDSARSPFWGLLFLLAPATLSAMERMTVDIGLTALVLAAILAARRQNWVLLWFALAAAALSKETGLLVITGAALWLVRQHRVRLIPALTSSLLPAAAWYAYVGVRAGGEYPTADFHFLSAFYSFLTPPLAPGPIAMAFRIATAVAAAALLWTALRAILLAFRDRFHDLALLLALLFGILVLLFQNSSIWEEPNGFTRIYSPLLVCLLAGTWRPGFAQSVATFGMVTLPMVMQLGVHLAGPWLRMVWLAT